MSWTARSWIKRLGSTFHLNDDDMVVFVVGPSGSGKSTFICAATQAHSLVEVGDVLKPHTKKVQAIRCELTEEARTALGAGRRKNIVFIDTPSFHTEDYNGAEKEMNTWLKQSRFKCTLSGTIYMHRIDTDPNANTEFSIQRQLDAFARAFPKDFIPQAFPGRVHCIFSYMDHISPEIMRDHKEKFQKQLSRLDVEIIHGWKPRWNASIHPDLFVKGDPNIAWEAIMALFSPPIEEKISTFQRSDDIVVFVVGPSGSGKSTFIRAATQALSPVKVEDTPNPHMKKVQVVRRELQEEARTALGAERRKNIVFVDTPSFYTEEKNEAEKEMNTWLKESKYTLCGTIYMHRVELEEFSIQIPLDGSGCTLFGTLYSVGTDPSANEESSVQMQLDAFTGAFPKDFIPSAFPGRVHCVFSYEDRIYPGEMKYRKERFQRQLSRLDSKIIHGWKPTWNTSIHPHPFVKGDPDTAWEAVKALFSPPESR